MGYASTPAPTRFWQKVDKSGDCWIYTGAIRNPAFGYGMFRVRTGKCLTAHKYSYELAYGKVPEGLVIDHLCRNRICVNPSHLEAVTIKENTLRGISPSAINAKKTHCPKGHEYDRENTMQIKGHRHCRECSRASTRLWRQRKRLQNAYI